MPKTLTEQYQLWMEAGATFKDVQDRIDRDTEKNRKLGRELRSDFKRKYPRNTNPSTPTTKQTDQERDQRRRDMDRYVERGPFLRRREAGSSNPEKAKMTAREKGAAIGLKPKVPRLSKLMHNMLGHNTRREP